MKTVLTLLVTFVFSIAWGQYSPAFKISSSVSMARSISELDKKISLHHPTIFSFGADYLHPVGTKDFVSVGIQYRKWKDNFDIPYLVGYCGVGIGIPPSVPSHYAQLVSYSELGIPIQVWWYSKEKAKQVFYRFGIVPTYVTKITTANTHFDEEHVRTFNRDEIGSWNFSGDMALGFQWNFSKRIHAYLAAKGYFFMSKEKMPERDDGYERLGLSDEIGAYQRAGYGLELGLIYR